MVGGPLDVFIGDVVRLRKPHPCGSHEWTVVRLGADIGLRCLGCEHRVLLSRRDLQKRLKTFVSRGPGYDAALAAVSAAGAASDGDSPSSHAGRPDAGAAGAAG
jgi:hypothetical protein